MTAMITRRNTNTNNLISDIKEILKNTQGRSIRQLELLKKGYNRIQKYKNY